MYIVVAKRLCDHRHVAETFPRATFEIGHLADDVPRRKRCQIGGLIVAGADWQMTGAARKSFGAVGDDRRHRRMHVGKPVRRIF